MEIHLVADTNLFFECKSLEQLPWNELGFDSIVILLTKPVLDEIDKHKKANGRTRKRALEIFGQVRSMLTASTQETEIRLSAPKVVLRRTANVKPDPGLKEDLDYGKTDEKLIGIAAALSAQAGGYVVKLFTDDTGPASSADALSVPFLMIPESWRRPPAETDEQKQKREYEKELAAYRSLEPMIVIGRVEEADDENRIQVVRTVATPLTDEEIEGLLDRLRAKHPLVTSFDPPSPQTRTTPTGAVIRTEFSPPPDEDIQRYRDSHYPQWIARCGSILKSLHEGADEIEPRLVVRWPIVNNGSRPAQKALVEFKAEGSLLLQRTSSRDNDDEPGDELSSPPADRASVTLPAAPPIPSFQRNETGLSVAPPAQPTRLTDLSLSIRAHALIDNHQRQIERLAIGLPDSALRSLSRGLTNESAAQMAARLLPNKASAAVESLTRMSRMPAYMERPLVPIVPPRHDPEAFYYDWPAGRPLTRGALTCDLWRHQRREEVFEFEVILTKDGEAGGTVECTVHADNLTRPEQGRLVVRRVLRQVNLMELATAMVDACR